MNYFLKLLIILLIMLPACHQSPRIKKNDKKKMVVIIPSYNNEQWCTKNLASVFAQKYTNYRVIYIDDYSTDNTYKKVTRYVKHKKQNVRTTIIKNKKRQGALYNIYHAVQSCSDGEIIVQLDGDDWFANRNVMEKINQLYCSREIWVTYGQFKNWPTGTMGYCKSIPPEIMEKNKFREFGHVAGALRTFYVRLFKKINKNDLVDDNGNFYQVAGDAAYMFPLLEMAGTRLQFVPEILCTRNVKTAYNDFKINKNEQEKITKKIQQKNKYIRLNNEGTLRHPHTD